MDTENATETTPPVILSSDSTLDEKLDFATAGTSLYEKPVEEEPNEVIAHLVIISTALVFGLIFYGGITLFLLFWEVYLFPQTRSEDSAASTVSPMTLGIGFGFK